MNKEVKINILNKFKDKVKENICESHDFNEWEKYVVRKGNVDLDGRSPNVYYTFVFEWSRRCRKCNYIEKTFDDPKQKLKKLEKVNIDI